MQCMLYKNVGYWSFGGLKVEFGLGIEIEAYWRSEWCANFPGIMTVGFIGFGKII